MATLAGETTVPASAATRIVRLGSGRDRDWWRRRMRKCSLSQVTSHGGQCPADGLGVVAKTSSWYSGVRRKQSSTETDDEVVESSPVPAPGVGRAPAARSRWRDTEKERGRAAMAAPFCSPDPPEVHCTTSSHSTPEQYDRPPFAGALAPPNCSASSSQYADIFHSVARRPACPLALDHIHTIHGSRRSPAVGVRRPRGEMRAPAAPHVFGIGIDSPWLVRSKSPGTPQQRGCTARHRR